MSGIKQYNFCLDFIKGVACVFVVFMHCEFPGIMGIVVQAVSRFSVPLFFMVSGYFCFRSGGAFCPLHRQGTRFCMLDVLHYMPRYFTLVCIC